MGVKKSVIFNLGSGQTSASCFSLEKDGKLALHHFFQRTFPCPNSEDEWLQEVSISVDEAIQASEIKGEVRVILPSSKLLAKTLRVPKVEADKQEKIVAYELSQKMPFPLDDLVWDYQVIDDDGIEQEILAFAVKKTNAEKLVDLFLQNGLSPQGLYPSTILDEWALKNSEDYDQYSDIMYINFGARSTDVIFSGATGFLVRNIGVGGNTLTQLIADSLGLSVEKAEELKLAYYQGRYQGEQNNSVAEKVAPASTSFLGKMGQELSRAVVNYKRLKKGKLPQVVLITGQVTRMSGFTNFISECLQLPVSYYNPFTQLIPGGDFAFKDHPSIGSSVSESFGLAQNLFAGNLSQEECINLLPKESIRAFEVRKKLPFLFLSFLFLAITPLPSLINGFSKEEIVSQKIIDSKQDLKIKNNTINDLEQKKARIRANQHFVRTATTHTNPLLNLKSTIFLQLSLLDSMEQLTESVEGGDLWLDEFNTFTKQTGSENNLYLKISGRYLVRLDDTEKPLKQEELMNALIDQNTLRQEEIIETIKNLKIVRSISKKTFSIEGKGDLFNRYFTHFEFDILL